MSREPEPGGELTPQEGEIAERLMSGRPVPSAGFRGALQHHLSARDPGYGPRPARLRLIVVAYLGVGLLLITLGSLLAL